MQGEKEDENRFRNNILKFLSNVHFWFLVRVEGKRVRPEADRALREKSRLRESVYSEETR